MGHASAEDREAIGRALWASVRAAHPRLVEALREDARVFARFHGGSWAVDSPLGLARAVLALSWGTDAFLALALYRVRARLLARRVPVLPTLLHRIAMLLCQLDVGEPVVIGPGVYLPHGQVVVDGFVEIGRGVVLTPWITIGLREGDIRGPRIGDRVLVGTGARILGPVRVGDGARIGANAVVLEDVPAGATAVGVPARVHAPAPAASRPHPSG